MKIVPRSRPRPIADSRVETRYSRTFRWVTDTGSDSDVRTDMEILANKQENRDSVTASDYVKTPEQSDSGISLNNDGSASDSASVSQLGTNDDDDATTECSSSIVLPKCSPRVAKYIDFVPQSLEFVSKHVPEGRGSHYTNIGRNLQMSFKMVKSDTKLIKTIFHSYGFTQCSFRNPSFNVLWTGAHLKPHVLRNLHPWQRVNHFPRSSELTRKDKMYENIARAIASHGEAYDFVPEFYVTPRDYDRLKEKMIASGGSRTAPTEYIVKPISSSRGRGIFFANKPDDIPLASSLLVSKYIDNPLTVNDHKFDLRVYVAVTSFHPLICYVYSEGLTRLASEKYTTGGKPGDEYVHLTNYSVNKNSDKFIRNETFSSEDYGHKWTLGALLRHLEKEGKDARMLMLRIEDLIIKSLLSAQSSIASVCRSTLISPNTCFELFGFDVLVDSEMKPWLLEVNLSPSLTCDAPLDSVVKTRLITDLFNLACVPLVSRKEMRSKRGNSGEAYSESDVSPAPSTYVSPRSVRFSRRVITPKRTTQLLPSSSPRVTSAYERRAAVHVRKLRIESMRQGGFVRVFPRKGSDQIYRPIMDPVGAEKWDARLYRDEFGEVSSNDDDPEEEARSISTIVHEQLIRCKEFPTFDSLSAEVKMILAPYFKDTMAYLNRITKEGEKYMAKLPSVRASARLRTKSCNDFYELKAAKLNDEVIDMVQKKDIEIGSIAEGKENAFPIAIGVSGGDIISSIENGRVREFVHQMST